MLSVAFTVIDWMMNYLLFVLCRWQDLTDDGRLPLIQRSEQVGYGRPVKSCERDRPGLCRAGAGMSEMT